MRVNVLRRTFRNKFRSSSNLGGDDKCYDFDSTEHLAARRGVGLAKYDRFVE